MDWNTAWQIASEIVDMLPKEITMREQEKMADIILRHAGQTFNTRHQEWRPISKEEEK